MLEHTELGQADSMDVKNDPRFFTDNILNYRLTAFGSLAVVSGLMVGNAMGALWDMDKNMQIYTQAGKIFHPNGVIQLIAFCMLIIILFVNMLATYIGVVQPYHTVRLMTAGPTGFECAVTYYLNRNIVTWRHLSIKYMLLSLPLYISQMGIRLIVKFDRENRAAASLPEVTPLASRVEGIVFCVCMVILAGMLYCVHDKHFSVFRERYETISRKVTGRDFNTYMNAMMTGRHGIDV